MRDLRSLLLAVALIVPAPRTAGSDGPAEEFPAERAFPGRPRQEVRAAGVSTRHKFGEDFYRICLYVDARELAARAAESERSPAALARLLVSGKVSHGYVTRFLRGVGREARVSFLIGNLRAYWPDSKFDPRAPSLRAFRAFFDRYLARDAVTEVFIDARGALYTREGQGPVTKTRDARIARAFAASYLAERSMDDEMKAQLIAGLPGLLEATRRAR